MLLVAEELARRGHAVTVATLEPPTHDFFEVPAPLRRVVVGPGLRCNATPVELLRVATRSRRLRDELTATRPDVVIAVEHRVAVTVAAAMLTAPLPPLLVWEQGAPRGIRLRLSLALLRRLLYPRTGGVVVVSEGLAGRLSWLARARRHVIRNPAMRIPDEMIPERLGELVDRSKRWVVTMGRLHRVKGYDLLLRSWALAAPRLADWQLIVIGEGAERARLEALRDELGLGASVALVGEVHRPFGLLRRAELYVLSSRAEGCPMTLIEAMSAGLPIVAFDCPSGLADLVSDGDNGLLVPREDVAAMAEALGRVLEDDALRAELAVGSAGMAKKFDGVEIGERWQRLLEATAGEAGRVPVG